ncbi:hypothetical protein tinsulaeT_04800 [Thalassotalea insulae]|uniref:HTH araC/xylS-type domain-containing protein n=1 Tax=Thalassotalea insulae TaxID=2056778 RepID=A0ABQ6GRT4_9GAMM|nr:helix-turn-helix transcriptional regulator [Thalassotalea insulae]GLX77140.1 hypothetical protein tinsulaeT_04800 [Thalassotalea insulae]
MIQENIISIILLIAAFGQIILAVSMILPRLPNAPIYFPLTLFFISSGLTFTLPALNTIWPELSYYSLFIIPPIIAVQPLSLWLYISGLTSPTPWQLSQRYWPHFIPAILGVLLSLYMATQPFDLVSEIFIIGKQPDDVQGMSIVISFFLLFIIFLIQTSSYLISIANKLTRYHKQLHMLFSSNEQRELRWVIWLVFIFVLTWLSVLLHLISTIFSHFAIVSTEVIAGCYFVMIWTLCVWGLRQKPGYHQRYLSEQKANKADDNLEQVVSSGKNKYQRSALGIEQSKSIADKLDHAMKEHQYYLHANLSLPELAQQLVVPANYLSQTLNEHLGESFFDYINRWRAEYAKELLIEGKLSILDIAMASGFNAKSSFYKSFKKHTGTTPGQFKQ